jgi:ferritin
MRFYNHIMERGGHVKLDAIKTPEGKWSTPVEAFQAAYEHELKVTKMINDLVELAQAEKDNASIYGILNWFIEEQIEEEEQTSTAVEKLKMAEGSNETLLMLDKEFGARPLPATMQIIKPGSAAGE